MLGCDPKNFLKFLLNISTYFVSHPKVEMPSKFVIELYMNNSTI